MQGKMMVSASTCENGFFMFLKDNYRSRGDLCRGIRCSYSWSLAGEAPPSLGREEPPRAPPRPRPRPPPRPRPRPRNPPRPEPPRPRPLPRYPPDRGLGAPSSSVPGACSRFTSSAESPDYSFGRRVRGRRRRSGRSRRSWPAFGFSSSWFSDFRGRRLFRGALFFSSAGGASPDDSGEPSSSLLLRSPRRSNRRRGRLYRRRSGAYLEPSTGFPSGRVTFAASLPFWPSTTSKTTFSPSPTDRRNFFGLFLTMAV